MEIRNIAIIAHVDHGKTTHFFSTDEMLEQCGMREEGVSMDSNALEQERGITIYAKNTSVFYTSKLLEKSTS
jgi:GTP-binding protein